MAAVKNTKFEVLSGREQILRRPQMWIGGMHEVEKDMFVITDNNTIEKKTVSYIPAFRKIQDEILDNAIDVLIEKCGSKGEIRVSMTSESVKISDNGPGIPVVKHDIGNITDKTISQAERDELANSYIPFTAWTRLFSGSNFQDSSSKTTIGAHGIGSKACSVFSTKFIGKTDDGKHACVVTTKNNLEEKSFVLKPTSKTTGTTVEFWPDLKRFNLKTIEPIYFELMHQRLMSLAIAFPEIKFVFNNKRINLTARKFLSMFSSDIESVIFDNGFIGVFPNDSDEFSFFSYVNGLYLSRGGTHIDYITSGITNTVREKLVKKYKSIKPIDIKNRLGVVIFLRDFPTPKFDSQTKETLTNSVKEVSEFISNSKVDLNAIGKLVLKNQKIINPIIDAFTLKEELKAKAELRSSTKRVRISADKYLPPIGNNNTYLALCEGMSACSGISSCLGRSGIGYYSMRGLPINVYTASMQKIAANQEFKDIMTILKLDLTNQKNTNRDIAFDSVLITTDNDADGSHLTSMILGWFAKFAPNLFHEGRIRRLMTPLILVESKKNDAIIEYFFNVQDFKNWENSISVDEKQKYKFKYLKGLGSWERSQLIELIDKFGLEHFIQKYNIDTNGEICINQWLGSDPTDRKNYLRNFSFDIDKV